MNWISKLPVALHLRRSRYRVQLADLPPGLEAYWRRTAPLEFKGIPTGAFFFIRAAEGLMNFFDAVTRSRTHCALPSDAADSVWHAWLRFNSIGLEKFCTKHFGSTVPHIERGELRHGALANALSTCRALEGLAPGAPRVPALFGLDARLRMPRGHGYWAKQGEVVYARLDNSGARLGRAITHPELTMAALFAAGLVTAEAYAQHRRQQLAAMEAASRSSFADAGGCGGGFGGGGDSSGCDSGGSDGGSGCGSSCGSGCGGGCGGGD